MVNFKVITINCWWDGPIYGLAHYNGIVCIYERIFDEIKDDWNDEYYLTPINSDLQAVEFSMSIPDFR